MKKITPYILLLGLILTMFSCIDEESFTTDTNAMITFSKDTISFDTVFSTIGSSTKSFQVYNNNDKAVKIKNISLASGGKSGFHLNVDGQSGTSFTDIDILKKDSIFVFVEVNVNPQDEDSPILIRDSLKFTLECGITKQVVLQAYGQDVIIMRDVEFKKDTTLSSERPYVIYDSIVVKPDAKLTIASGATLCFHSDAELSVHGTLIAKGTLEKPITFRGDRTDKMFWYLPYDRLDGQWGGIYLAGESADNVLDYVDIHGGNYGIICDSTGIEKTKLTLTNSSIHNVKGFGISSFVNRIFVANCQITNAGADCVNIIGGYNEFYHTTVAQFYPWSVAFESTLKFGNTSGDNPYPLEALKFYNCIITGVDEDVIYGSKYTNADEALEKACAFNVEFNNCLVRTDSTGCGDFYKDCVFENKDSVTCGATNFKNIDEENYIYNFELDSLSRARNIGNPEYSKLYATDKNGKIRKTDHPDAGCYEF